MIPNRFKKCFDSSQNVVIDNNEKISTVSLPNINNSNSFKINNNLSKTEKYNLLWRPAQELCSAVSELDNEEFKDKLGIFILVKEYFEKNKFSTDSAK